MSSQVAEVLDSLKSLGTPAELRALADEGFGPIEPLPANAHIHLPPNFSAFESVEQAVGLATEQQIAVLGVSNYYDYQVYGDFGQQARAQAIFPLFGLEIICMQDDLRESGVKVNDPGNPGKTYICGKGITRFAEMTAEADRLLNVIRDNDGERMQQMIARMNSCFGDGGLNAKLDEAAVIDMVVRRHGSPRETVYLQERHASQAFQELLSQEVPAGERIAKLDQILGASTKAAKPDDDVTMQNDIRSHLMKAGKPAFVEEAFVGFDEAKQLVLELGGIPCYPTLADGTSPLCDFEADIDRLIETLQSRGVHAAEFIPVRNSPEVTREYVTRMRAAGLLMTSGTEHNTLDLIPFAPACNDQSMDPALQAIFWEGACVVAAHQFLTTHGECGYVDSNGQPNPDYADADERIRSLASLGAAVIGKYQQRCREAAST